MKRAAEKLNSRRGASLLLALVFVLLCVMVGVSILSAAASNAGRTRSNHEEQQLYLSLSSALQLVADDLTNARYTPQVSDKCNVSRRYYPVTDGSGNIVTTIIYTTYIHTFSRAKGEMDGSSLESLLFSKLDDVFNNYMSSRYFPSYSSGYDTFSYVNNYSPATPTPFTFTLTVAPEDLPEVDKDTYHAAQEVAVDVTIDDNYRITLTARLARDDADDYAKSFRLSTVLTRSSSVLPDITLPTYGIDDRTTILPAYPAVTWKQGVIESAYDAGGASS